MNVFFEEPLVLALLVLLLGVSLAYWLSRQQLAFCRRQIANFHDLRRAFIDADQRAIYLKDEHLRYVFVNQTMAKLMQRAPEEIVGQDDFMLDQAEYAARKRASDLEALEKRAVCVSELKWQERIYQALKFPVQQLNGEYGVGAYVWDVTEERQRRADEEKTLLRHAILADVFSRNFASSQEQLDFVLTQAIRLTDSAYGYIYLYDQDKQQFVLNTWSNNLPVDCQVIDKQTAYKLQCTDYWGEAVRQPRPVVVNQLLAPEREPDPKPQPDGSSPQQQLTRFMTVPVVNDDQIVAVIGLANKQTDYEQSDVHQVSLLMSGVWNAKVRRDREVELAAASAQLAAHKDQLQLILDSAAEAIYGIDLAGKCTFCNASSLRMLGYAKAEDLLGKNMHWQIHHSYADGRRMQPEDCRVIQALRNGQGVRVDDEVLWRSDGSSFPVEYYAYPQLQEGKVTGAVVTFTDISERKQAQAKIAYLSFNDPLTGLYNRAFFEAEMRRLDTPRNLPLAIISGDLNGLKLTNDVFGHAAGDLLLKKVAEVCRRVCRADDIIARVGGDEFCILLPRTQLANAEAIAARIKQQFAEERIVAIKGSISLGCDAKVSPEEQLLAVYESADNKMYLDKTLHRRAVNADLIETIISTLHTHCPLEQGHSEAVSATSQALGEALGWTEGEVRKLREAAYLHDIGKVVLENCLDYSGEDPSQADLEGLKQHPAVGYRILNLFDETMDLADAALSHHEHWDGTGYPKGLQGAEIPRLARVIAVCTAYDRLIRPKPGGAGLDRETALQEIAAQAGREFDPEIAQLFVELQRQTGHSA